MSSASSAPHDGRRVAPLIVPPGGADRVRTLVERNRAALGRYLTRIGVPQSELDDVMQEAFMVTTSRLGGLESGTERAFLFASALYVAQNTRRGSRRRQRAADSFLQLPSEPLPSADDLTDQLRARAMLEEALEQLPGETRLVFFLFELQDMPLASIAKRLGLPEGTVASRLRRARRILATWSARATASAAFERSRTRGPSALAHATHGDAEILSWWVSRGETEALRALLGLYNRSHPNASFVNAAVSGTPIARQQLRSRMTRGKPPDTFQVNGGTDLFSWVGYGTVRERMEPLDFLFSSEGWAAAFPPDVLELVTHSGRLYAVPVDIHRINTLFYNKSTLAGSGLAPPSTLEELHDVADTLRARGMVPFSIGYKDPWTLTMLAFENVMVAVAGGDYYRDFFSGKCDPDDPELYATLTHVARILDYANADAATLGWDDAVELLRTGTAAMTIMGDWAKGYLRSSRTPFEFGEVPSPGAEGAFVFATDTFGLPKRAAQRASAIELLKVFGSKEGQDAFNPLKGSIPARTDADLSRYDPLAQATARDFWTAPRYPSLASLASSTFTQALDSAMGTFARDRNPDAVADAIRAHYDLLSPVGGRGLLW
ncbi:MAG: extracellular solute-binding protein [Polyangiaceae bacterium]